MHIPLARSVAGWHLQRNERTTNRIVTGVLVVGFLLGMTHAVEADHLAAVATLASQSKSVRTSVRAGLLWGLGHMTMLVLVGGVALMVGTAIPDHLAALLETIVGVMLVALGLDALRRALRPARGTTGPHTHGFLFGRNHDHVSTHDVVHTHVGDTRWRPFVVGLVHGVAGSAALVVLAAGAVHDAALGLGYVLLFGVGSAIGMGLVSLAFALPMHFAARRVPRFATVVSLATGLFSVAVGVYVIASSAPEI